MPDKPDELEIISIFTLACFIKIDDITVKKIHEEKHLPKLSLKEDEIRTFN